MLPPSTGAPAAALADASSLGAVLGVVLAAWLGAVLAAVLGAVLGAVVAVELPHAETTIMVAAISAPKRVRDIVPPPPAG
jgi:hypothetical protein